VATIRFVRDEGEVIRHNMGWTFQLLTYLSVTGIACLGLFPAIAILQK
jgi:lactate permease